MKALGCHVFAGGFTRGVKRIMEVDRQLEIHEFGRATVESIGVEFLNRPNWKEWPKPDKDVVLLFGNPRCTGFSTMTGSCKACTHGPWADQTVDIHDLCHYGADNKVPVIVWESVQQAFSVGRPLLDMLRDELFAPAGYRIVHLFLNARTFGNPQNRKRYFFVAYRTGNNFNADPPPLFRPLATTRILEGVSGEGHEVRFKHEPYDGESYGKLSVSEKECIPYIPNGYSMNRFARDYTDLLEEICPRYWNTWMLRNSSTPFSAMHCISRLRWDVPAPTLHSSSWRLLHPERHRCLTVREMSMIMGWDGEIPCGGDPAALLAKGIVPAIGQWLAEQVIKNIEGGWGDQDWSSKFNDKTGVWDGEFHSDSPVEKVIHMGNYV